MTLSLRSSTLALAFMVLAVPLYSGAAHAKSSFMTECSAKFKAAKADGSVDANAKWTDFMKTQCKADTAAVDAPVVDAPVATPVKKTKAVKKAVDAPVAEIATTPSGSFMKDCGVAWKDMKTNNTVPEGMTWKTFVAGKCVATPVAAKATTVAAKSADKGKLSPTFIAQCGEDWKAMKTAGTVPEGLTWKAFVIGKCKATPAAAPAVAATGQTFMQKCSVDWKAMKAAGTTPEGMAWKDFIAAKCVVEGMAPAEAIPVMVKKPPKKKAAVVAEVAPDEPTAEMEAKPVKLADKNGKPFTAGQLAAHDRARTCGAKWRAEKLAGTLDDGAKWPQYWSSCNKELKAASQ